MLNSVPKKPTLAIIELTSDEVLWLKSDFPNTYQNYLKMLAAGTAKEVSNR
jgi:hypothetical protein